MSTAPGPEAAAGDAGEALVGWALEIGRPVLVRDLRQEPLFADLEIDGNGRGPRSVLSYPWTLRGRPAGIVFLARNGDGRPFDTDNREFLTLAMAPVIYLLKKNGGRPGGCCGAAAGHSRPRGLSGRSAVGPARPGHDREDPRYGRPGLHRRGERHGERAGREDRP
jgi:hypothetical protein